MMIHTLTVNYQDPAQAAALIDLLDAYARDPMGGGEALRDEVRANLIPALAARPGAFSVLAYAGDVPVGMANCFEGFSTFACKPLINIHDFAVLPEYRGRGIGRRLLEHIERIAAERGCCKMTLEVLQTNEAAQYLYRRFGFGGYTLTGTGSVAQFWQKYVPAE